MCFAFLKYPGEHLEGDVGLFMHFLGWSVIHFRIVNSAGQSSWCFTFCVTLQDQEGKMKRHLKGLNVSVIKMC